MTSRPPTSPSDAELVIRAREGDQVAFGDLVARHSTVAFRAAYLVLRDEDQAADAAQEAFINVHRALSRFRSDEPFVPWLLTIVGNRARNHRRAQWRRTAVWRRAAAAVDASDRTTRSVPSPEADVVAAERRAVVLAAVNDLTPGDRVVLSCRYFAQLGESETAALLGVRRARDRLRFALEARGVTDA